MKVPHGIPAQQFIDWVNFNTQDEAKRCRILLAELLLRVEKIELPPYQFTSDGELKVELTNPQKEQK